MAKMAKRVARKELNCFFSFPVSLHFFFLFVWFWLWLMLLLLLTKSTSENAVQPSALSRGLALGQMTECEARKESIA